jgi:hypothetical protein
MPLSPLVGTVKIRLDCLGISILFTGTQYAYREINSGYVTIPIALNPDVVAAAAYFLIFNYTQQQMNVVVEQE